MSSRSCTAPDCARPHKAKGYCGTHYNMVRIEGAVRPIAVQRRNAETCLHCDRAPKCMDLCAMHYSRHRRGASLTLPYKPPGKPRIDWSDPVSVDCNITGVHARLKRLWGPATQYPCIECGKPAREWAYDGTDPSQKLGQHGSRDGGMWYSVYPEFYMPLCLLCHRRRDRANSRRELQEYRQWIALTGKRLTEVTFQ